MESCTNTLSVFRNGSTCNNILRFSILLSIALITTYAMHAQAVVCNIVQNSQLAVNGPPCATSDLCAGWVAPWIVANSTPQYSTATLPGGCGDAGYFQMWGHTTAHEAVEQPLSTAMVKGTWYKLRMITRRMQAPVNDPTQPAIVRVLAYSLFYPNLAFPTPANTTNFQLIGEVSEFSATCTYHGAGDLGIQQATLGWSNISIDVGNNAIGTSGNDVSWGQVDSITIVPVCCLLSVSATSVPGGANCCYNIGLQNNVDNISIFGIRATVTTPGFTIANAAAPGGLVQSPVIPTGTVVSWTSLTAIAMGTYNGQLCVTSNTGGTTASVKFEWLNQDGRVVCTQTQEILCQGPCMTIARPRLSCIGKDQNGNWQYQLSMSLTSVPTGILAIVPNSGAISGITPSGNIPASFSGVVSATWVNTGNVSNVCFRVRVLSQFGVLCEREICLDVPPCNDVCPCPFKFAVINPVAYQGIGNQVWVGNPLGVTPLVRRLTATIVSASVAQTCYFWGGSSSYSSAATISSVSPTAPFVVTGINSSSVTWTNLSCASVSASNWLSMYLNVPNAPGFFCTQKVKICIRYTITDCECRSCDTTVCYELVRRRRLFWLEPPVITGIGNPLDKDLGSELQSGSLSEPFATISMANSTDGTLTINNPQEDSTTAAVVLRSFTLLPQAGITVLSMKPSRVGWTDGNYTDSGMTSLGRLEPGASMSFALKFANDQGRTAWGNNLHIAFSVPELPDSILLTGDFPVTARTPAGKGGDTLVRDITPGEQRKDVRTYALKFTSGNAAGDSIAKVVIRAKGGPRILAIGPGTDSASVTLRAYASDSTGARWLLTAPTAAQSESAVATGHSLGPIYITVEGAGLPDAMFEYATVTADGDTVSKGEISVREFTTGIRSVDDGRDAVTTVSLADCHPNPLTGTTTISFRLAAAEPAVWLVVSDVQGGEVAQLVSGTSLEAGEHRLEFNAIGLPSGVYYYTLRTRGATQTRTMHVVR